MNKAVEMERNFLGCLLLMAVRELAPSDIASVCNGLSPDDFMQAQHKTLFSAIKNRSDKGQVFDTVLIIEDCGPSVDHRYIFETLKNSTSTANVNEYKRRVKSNATRRGGIIALDTIADLLNSDLEPYKALGEAESIFQSLMGKAHFGGSSFTHIKQILLEYIDDVEARLAGSPTVASLTTGMKTIDENLEGGFQPGSLVVVGGRPGSGKSSILLSFIKGMAYEMQDRSALAFSLEMSKLQLGKRYVNSHIGIGYNRMIEELKRDPDQTIWDKIFGLVGTDSELPIYISDSSSLTVEQVCADARQHARDNKIGAICIDYLGLMDMPTADRHDLSIGKVTRALKVLAMELNCVVILLAQINRGVEKREDKRPIASDFANSGAIESDADYVVTLYRDNYYNETSMMGDIGEVNFVKNRHGQPFKVFMNFTGGNWIDNCDQAQAYNLMSQSTEKPKRPYANGI